MEELEKAKKRSWGKTKHRGKPSLSEVDHSVLGPVTEPNKRIRTFEEPTQIDLQHPELMDNDSLVKTLRDVKVPIPMYPDGTPSRERLIYLFKKHVTPQPQRSKVSRSSKSWRKSSNLQSKSNCITHTGLVDDMEIDNTELANTEQVPSPISRKRHLENADIQSSPSKRSALSAPCTPFSKISMSDPPSPTDSKQPTPLHETDSKVYPSPKDRTIQPRLMKLRRPPVTNQTPTDSIIMSECVTATNVSEVDSVSEDRVEEIASPRVHKDKITWP